MRPFKRPTRHSQTEQRDRPDADEGGCAEGNRADFGSSVRQCAISPISVVPVKVSRSQPSKFHTTNGAKNRPPTGSPRNRAG